MQNCLFTDKQSYFRHYKQLETIQKAPQALGNNHKVTKTEKSKQTKIAYF